MKSDIGRKYTMPQRYIIFQIYPYAVIDNYIIFQFQVKLLVWSMVFILTSKVDENLYHKEVKVLLSFNYVHIDKVKWVTTWEDEKKEFLREF